MKKKWFKFYSILSLSQQSSGSAQGCILACSQQPGKHTVIRWSSENPYRWKWYQNTL